MKDGFGNIVTTCSEKSVEAIDRFSNSLVGLGTDFAVAFEASDEDPDCAVLSALATQLALFMESPDRGQFIDKFLNRAIAAAPGATEREQLFVEAMNAHCNNDFARATSLHRRLAADYPQDLVSAKIGQTLYFNLGDDEGMLWLADQIIDTHRDCAYAHGMRAFGLEQMSRLEEAEEEGRRATQMLRREPWAHHAVAHVMITQGRLDDGINWMREYSSEWEDCNSFMYTHNWWHLALFHLEKEEFDQALALYDGHIWGQDKTYSQDQINAISMLWRLELAGVEVGDRWEELSEYVAERSFVNDQPFLDMQYAFALARGGRKDALHILLEGMRKVAAEGPEVTKEAWQNVAIPATESFIAYAEGDFKKTLSLLATPREKLQSIGGSHAQRDLFEQVWIHSLMKAKKFDQALPLIQERLDFRAPAKIDQTLFSKAKKFETVAI
ncbi:MAG: tetratricopeptide repeat protein [Sneathiellales bacterium]|nr:tetratricopeptide repeat protein [Sneathiellales bacterium]